VNILIDKNLKYSVNEEVIIEEFPDTFLLFCAKKLKLLKINSVTKLILDLMNGVRSIGKIVETIAEKFELNKDDIAHDVSITVLKMISEDVIFPVVKIIYNGELDMDENTKLMANPDVSCRVEDEDGAILFNPDTDSTQIINPIGLDIWRALERHPKTLSDVVSHIKNLYNDAPSDQVSKDVEEFIMNLHTKGFIGEIVDEK